MDTIFAVGQTVSLFLAIIFFIAVISARTERSWPGLALCLLMLAASIWAGVSFQKEYFFYMLLPTVACFVAWYISRKTRAKNIEKGLHYNEEGVIEEELK